jgi:hypothetical protein
MSQNANAGKSGTPKSNFFGFGLGSTKNAGATNIQPDLSRRNTTAVIKKTEPKDDPQLMRRATIDDRLPKGFKNKLIELEFSIEKGQVS